MQDLAAAAMPGVVCLCGSARFGEQIAAAARELTRDGVVVLAPVFLGAPVNSQEREGLDRLHRRRIDMAQRVLVVNPGGYVGDGTADEIGYALRVGKEVAFVEKPCAMRLDPEHYAAFAAGSKQIEARMLDAKRAGLREHQVVRFEGGAGALLARITRIARYADRAALLDGLDPAAVIPGADRGVLSAALEGLYPGRGGEPMVALGVQVLGPLPGVRTPRDLARAADPAAPPWAATAAGMVLCDAAGRVLLVKTADRLPAGRWVLPGASRGGSGRSPRESVRRVVREQLGLAELEAGPLLCVDHLPPQADGAAAPVVCLYDGGTLGERQIGAIRLPARELSSYVFVDPADASAMLGGGSGRRLRWAVRSLRGGWGTVELEDGRVRGEPDLVARDGLRPLFTWHESPVPAGLPVTQVYGWLLDPDTGRVLLQDRGRERYNLPGGRPEPADGDPVKTLMRECWEESQVRIGEPVYLGYQSVVGDAQRPYPYAQLRFAAPILRYAPIAPDPDTDGQMYRRLLTSLVRAPELLGWGIHGHGQAEAARRAGRALGLPVDDPASEGHLDHEHAPTAAQPPSGEGVQQGTNAQCGGRREGL